MVEKLTIDRPASVVVERSSAGAPSNARIRLLQGPLLQPSEHGAQPQVRLSGAPTLRDTADIHRKALHALSGHPGSDAQRSSSAHHLPKGPAGGSISNKAPLPPDDERKITTARIIDQRCSWEDAVRSMQKLQDKGIKPSAINYGALMANANRNLGQPGGSATVIELYKSMRLEGVQPNIRICTTVITAMGRQRRPIEEVKEVEKELWEIDRKGEERERTDTMEIDSKGKKIERADIIAISALMSAYARVGDTNEVQTLHERVMSSPKLCAEKDELPNWLLAIVNARQPLRSKL
jgi:hypothetical protein